MHEIVKGIMSKVGEGLGFMTDTSEILQAESEAESPEGAGIEDNPDDEDGMLDISDADSDDEK